MLSDVDAKVQSLLTARSTHESECRELEENVRSLKETLALQEKSLNQQKLNLGICQGKVEVYQAFLHPMEEQISILRGLASGASEQDDRMPIIAELKHTLMTLGEMSEAVSLN
jgi:chromosome segregation ATPase